MHVCVCSTCMYVLSHANYGRELVPQGHYFLYVFAVRVCTDFLAPAYKCACNVRSTSTIVCTLSTLMMHIQCPQDDITETKIYVIAILTSLAVANVAPIAVVALAWKICEHL